jgi:hypothetical protein
MSLLAASGGTPLHHDPAFSTDHVFIATVVFVLLLVMTVWALLRGAGRGPAIVLVVLAVAWIAVDPIHEPSIYTFLKSHAVTPGDLLAVPALAVAAVVAARANRET